MTRAEQQARKAQQERMRQVERPDSAPQMERKPPAGRWISPS